MKYTQVETKNADDRKLLLGVLIQMGYLWHRNSDDVDDPNEVELRWDWTRYPTVNIDPDEKHLSGTCVKYHGILEWPEDAAQIFQNIINVSKNEITVEGVGEYEAIIKEDGIHVGCQLITFEKFAEIVEAVKTFK